MSGQITVSLSSEGVSCVVLLRRGPVSALRRSVEFTPFVPAFFCHDKTLTKINLGERVCFIDEQNGEGLQGRDH